MGCVPLLGCHVFNLPFFPHPRPQTCMRFLANAFLHGVLEIVLRDHQDVMMSKR